MAEQPPAGLPDGHLCRRTSVSAPGLVTAAGDPVQAWNTTGKVFYGGIAFNRAKPNNGSIWLARYDWPRDTHARPSGAQGWMTIPHGGGI